MAWEIDLVLARWIKEVVTTVATCIGVGIAWAGLTTWNRQLKGQTEYELSRRVLRCTYNLREALRNVRRPEILLDEQVLPDDNASMSEKQIGHYVMETAYRNRWEKVQDARSELQTELLEAEVVWGNVLAKHFEPLFKLQQELISYINAYLVEFDPDASQEVKAVHYAMRRERRPVNFNLPGARVDPFWTDVESAISDIESQLKPYLKKKGGVLSFGDSR